jgi:FAD/FMN-containing dehydrogenase
MTVETEIPRIEAEAISQLGAQFRGELVVPDDAGYEEHRAVWNGSINRYPALIARCTGVADVIAAVRFARERDILAAVRGGEHSFPGHSTCDGGMVIDLGPMKSVRVDPDKRTVHAQPGVLLGELDRETQQFGTAVPAGIVTTTGLAGLTLGGGIGWLMRKYGLTIDQLLSVDVITAEGEYVKASADENADLFWGVCGGGGNFGIVTSFSYRLNPVGPTVVAGPVAWPMADSPAVLRFLRDWLPDQPDELTTITIHRRAPALPPWPEELHGKHVVIVAACYAGSVEDGERVLRPLKEFGSPVLDACVPKPFLAHQAFLDPGFPRGRWYYFRSCDIADLSDDVIDIAVEHSLRIKSPFTAWPIFQLGGAIDRVAEDDTAYNGRGSGFTLNVASATDTVEGFEDEREWARGLWEALEPHHTSVYVNFMLDEGEERIREAYGAAKFDRLKALKQKYDPENFFRLNQNIAP